MQTANSGAPALIVIDVQDAFFESKYWGASNNPACESNIDALVTRWQTRGWPIVMVTHDSLDPDSPLHPSAAGNALQSFLGEVEPSLTITKTVNSSFLGTPSLHDWLREQGIASIVLCGIQSNMCVETTARMGGNLGYEVTVAIDATRTFDLAAEIPGLGHLTRSADELMQAAALNLSAGGFATVTTTAAVLTQ
ncbi:cysteine hydrolase family protein [Humidisolicoccus flavus]|uniref:cysteine hydrolase family protein n=1 Tax=Humidisolicoccus flavus TaxID=3111414 RepID=UPI00325336DA